MARRRLLQGRGGKIGQRREKSEARIVPQGLKVGLSLHDWSWREHK